MAVTDRRQPPCACCSSGTPDGCLAPDFDTEAEPAGCNGFARVGSAFGIDCRCLATGGRLCEDCARWARVTGVEATRDR